MSRIALSLQSLLFPRSFPLHRRRSVFRFLPLVAPIKATVFPLLQKAELNEVATRVSAELTAAGLANIVDTTGTTIGKR